MSEEDNTIDDEGTDTSTLSPDDMLKVIEKLRRENASRRVKSKEVEDKAALWEKHLESQKTELDKLTESEASLKRELETMKLTAVRDRVAQEEKVPPELVEFLLGTDEPTLREKAKKLAASAKSNEGTKAPDFFAGQRGVPVKPAGEKENLNDFLAKMWKDVNDNPSGSSIARIGGSD